MKPDRLIRDGRVAVLISPGFGAGWSTWCHGSDITAKAMMFDPQIADIVDRGNDDWIAKANAIARLKYPDEYHGGLEDLMVVWVPQGQKFRIREYDGSESIELEEDVTWITA